MSASVNRVLWSRDSGEALQAATARWRDEAKQQAAYAAAIKNHPLYGCYGEQADSETIRQSEAPRWRMVARDFGNGHRECVVMREIPDPAATLERAIERDLRHMAPRGASEDREANIQRAVRRAKQDVRHKCKAMLVNSLWTLTYRENVQDREVVMRHLDLFRRRVAAVLGEWRYIAVLERQERGAYHIHLATHALPVRIERGGVKLKSWNVMRAIWRSVVGALGGNFDEAKRRRRWSGKAKPVRGAGAIASYIAGYVAKDMQESELNKRRYSSSKGIDVPDAYRAMWAGDVHMSELITIAYAAVGERITRSWFDRERGVFFIESDDSASVALSPS